MSETSDRLKSLFRQALVKAKNETAKLPGVAQAKSALRDLRDLGAVVPMELLRADLLRVPGLQSLSAHVGVSGVHVEATFDDADDLILRILPTEVRFAPRGAKEVSFEISPAELARHKHTQDLVVAVATSIARGLWAAVLRGPNSEPLGAIVDRDSDNVFRIDLRTLSVLKSARGGQAVGVMLDALSLSAIHATDGALRLKVQTPFAF